MNCWQQARTKEPNATAIAIKHTVRPFSMMTANMKTPYKPAVVSLTTFSYSVANMTVRVVSMIFVFTCSLMVCSFTSILFSSKYPLFLNKEDK